MRKRSNYYILDGREIVNEPDVVKWAIWFDNADKRIGVYTIGDIMISTVFLGLDHRLSPKGPPALFETMVFGGDLDQECERYCTYDEAKKGQYRMIARVRRKVFGV